MPHPLHRFGQTDRIEGQPEDAHHLPVEIDPVQRRSLAFG
jgi:hypothetical protein